MGESRVAGTAHTPMTAKYCHLCGRTLQGDPWRYTPDGESSDQMLVVCAECHATAPHCAVCDMPMGPNAYLLPDGRKICPRCARTAITALDEARALFECVARVMTEQLDLGLNVGTDFTLLDAMTLRQWAGESGVLDEGRQQVVGLFVRRGRLRVMGILLGLPRLKFIKTVAHEWGHAWHGENCPLMRDLTTREGFAEWAAHRALRALGEVDEAQRMEQRNGIYGEGLRLMLRMESVRGVDGVLLFCRKSE